MSDAARADIWAVRHARIDAARGLCYGHTDWPVDDDACREQAAALARQLPPLPIVSSPLQRCLRLAQALADLTLQSLTIDPRLLEIHFGDWEGRPWDSIPRQALDAWAANPVAFAAPNGESFDALIGRVKAAQRELPAATIWITHAGVIRGLSHVCHALPAVEAAQVQVAHLVAYSFRRAMQHCNA